jgi:CelD/BcsL family acetyltransferase involved in cellulose biosynthesis
LNSTTYSQIALPGFAPVRIRLATQIRDFAEFWPRWNTLGEARCYPFQCADILELYCDTFVPARSGEPLFVAILDQHDEPVMLIPLVIQSFSDYTRVVKKVRILKFLDFWFADYNAPVVFPAAANWDINVIQIIWRGLRKLLPSFDIAVFEKMPECVGDLRNPLSLLKTASDRYSGHAAHLSGSWEDFARRLPDRKRWRTRRFRELGERSLTLAKTPEQYDVFIDALIRQTRERYPKALGLPDEVAYLKMARRLVYPAGPVCLFALKINDSVIATEFCLLRERWMIGQLLSHEPGSWQTYAPGHLLNTMVCEWCFANGIAVLDFGIGDYPYKKEYCDVMIKLSRAELPANMRGRLGSRWRAAGDWRRERSRRLALQSRSNATRPLTSLQPRNYLACSQITLPGSVPVQICVARHLQALAEFWPSWNTLGEARCYPFQCADILELYCETFVAARSNEPLFIAIIDHHHKPLMLIPLVIEPYSDYTRVVKNVRILKFPDFGFSDYNAPVVFPPVANWDTAAVRAIWNGMRKILPSFDIAMFQKIPERVGDLPNPFSLLRTMSDPYTGHAACLSTGWQQFSSKLPSRRSWRTRRFQELGDRSLELAETPAQYDVFIEALLRQKRERFPRFATLPDEIAYFRTARRLVFPAGPVCLFALKISDTIVATAFCLLRGRWMIGHMFSHDRGSWRFYAPGHLLMNMICEWCFANQVDTFDFGIGDEPYKDEYCEITNKLWKAAIPVSVRGVISSHWRAAGDWRRERSRRAAAEAAQTSRE